MTLEQSSHNILLEKFNETRARTLELVKTLEKDDFGVQTAFYTSCLLYTSPSPRD